MRNKRYKIITNNDDFIITEENLTPPSTSIRGTITRDFIFPAPASSGSTIGILYEFDDHLEALVVYDCNSGEEVYKCTSRNNSCERFELEKIKQEISTSKFSLSNPAFKNAKFAQSIKISNLGLSILEIKNLKIIGKDAKNYRFAKNKKNYLKNLTRYGDVAVKIKLNTKTAGNKQAFLRITTNDPVNPFTTVKLEGKVYNRAKIETKIYHVYRSLINGKEFLRGTVELTNIGSRRQRKKGTLKVSASDYDAKEVYSEILFIEVKKLRKNKSKTFPFLIPIKNPENNLYMGITAEFHNYKGKEIDNNYFSLFEDESPRP